MYFLLVLSVVLVEVLASLSLVINQLSRCKVSPSLEEGKENIALEEVKRKIPLVMEARNWLVDK